MRHHSPAPAWASSSFSSCRRPTGRAAAPAVAAPAAAPASFPTPNPTRTRSNPKTTTSPTPSTTMELAKSSWNSIRAYWLKCCWSGIPIGCFSFSLRMVLRLRWWYNSYCGCILFCVHYALLHVANEIVVWLRPSAVTKRYEFQSHTAFSVAGGNCGPRGAIVCAHWAQIIRQIWHLDHLTVRQAARRKFVTRT